MQKVIIYLGLPKTKSTFLAESYKKKNYKIISCPVKNSYKKAFQKIKKSKSNFFVKCEDLYFIGSKKILENYVSIYKTFSKLKGVEIILYYTLRKKPNHICSFYSEFYIRLKNKNKIFRNFKNIKYFFNHDDKNSHIKDVIDIFDHKKNLKNIKIIFKSFKLKKQTFNDNARNKIMSNQVNGKYFRKNYAKLYKILKKKLFILKYLIPTKIIDILNDTFEGDKIHFNKNDSLKINEYFKNL